MVNKDIANNQDLLRQTLAHEIIHHHLYQEYGNEVAKHGEHFNLLADRINQKEGENFVSQFADETDFKPNASLETLASTNIPKLLYHQTTRTNAEKIQADGYISPRIGAIVQTTESYGDDGEGLEPAVFMSGDRNHLGYYALWQMERASKKKIKREDFTISDLARYGALILVDPQDDNNSIYRCPEDFEGRTVIDVKTGEHVKYIGDKYVEQGLPNSVERGDYFSLEPVQVYRVLKGKPFVDYLKQYSQHPVIRKILQNTSSVDANITTANLKIPEIKWSYPTDKELFNEIQTEHDIEKLLVEEMWPTKSHYQSAVDELKKVAAPEDLDPKKLKGRHIWNTYEDLVKTVKSFGGPKDPDSMLEAINSGKPLPMPIVIRKRNGELHVAGGATRSGIANLADQKITALVIDEKKANERMADRHEKKGYQYVIDENAEHLWEGIKEYFFANGPKPEITKDEKFIAHLIGIRLEIIARLRGIDIKDKNNKWEEYIITSDFKTVEKKFIDQGVAKEDVKEYIESFRKLRDKNRIQDAQEKDIDFWGNKSFDDFKSFVDKLSEEKSKTETKKLKKMEGAEPLAENEDWLVYEITTHEACMLYGSGTKWCITQPDGNHWKQYSSQHRIYFLLSRKLEKNNKFYKIAITVDMDEGKTYWDALDKEYGWDSFPPNLNIPQIKFERFDLNSKSEEVQLKAVKKYGSNIQYIDNPSEQVQLEAVRQDPSAIESIKNPSEQVQLEAIKKDAHAISYIENPSEKVQLGSMDKLGTLALLYIKKPSEKVQYEAVNRHSNALRFLENPSEELQLKAVKKYGDAIEFIKNPSEEVQLEAVKQDGYAISHIKNPSEQVQLEAVKQESKIIQYIKNPTEKVQLEAVKQNGSVIQYIKDPSEKVQLEAIKKSGWAIEHIKNPSEQVQLEAVKDYGALIEYIKNPSEEVQIEAVKQTGRAIEYIKNPTDKVKEYVKNKATSSVESDLPKPHINYVKPSFEEFYQEARNETIPSLGDWAYGDPCHIDKEVLKKIAKIIYDEAIVTTITKNDKIDIAGKIPPKKWFYHPELVPENEKAGIFEDGKYRFVFDDFESLIPALFDGSAVSMPCINENRWAEWGRHRIAYALALEGKCKCLKVNNKKWVELMVEAQISAENETYKHDETLTLTEFEKEIQSLGYNVINLSPRKMVYICSADGERMNGYSEKEKHKPLFDYLKDFYDKKIRIVDKGETIKLL